MINHSKNPNFSVDSRFLGYRIQAIKDITKGEEIFVNYDNGNFTNEDFL